MSFGELSPSPIAAPAPPSLSELHRLLKPLALNNAALQHTTQLVNDDPAPSPSNIKRMRALRDQNRNIASAAATLVTQLSTAPDPHTLTNLKGLLNDFFEALAQSVDAERRALLRTNHSASPDLKPDKPDHPDQPHSPPPANHELRTALKDEEENYPASFALHRAEANPLVSSAPLSFVAQPQPVYRSIDVRDTFVSERRAELTDIQASVDDVNTIFKDLALMVDEQRPQVDCVEGNTAESAVRVESARRELQKLQRRRNVRKKLFFCTLITVASVIALFLAFLLS